MRNSIHPLWHSIKRFSSPSPHNPASPPLSTHSSNTNKASKRYKRVSIQSLSDNSKWPLSSSPNSLPLGSKMVTIKINMKIFSKSILFLTYEDYSKHMLWWTNLSKVSSHFMDSMLTMGQSLALSSTSYNNSKRKIIKLYSKCKQIKNCGNNSLEPLLSSHQSNVLASILTFKKFIKPKILHSNMLDFTCTKR